MRQLSKELCIRAAPCIRPISERDRHTHTHQPLSFSPFACLPTTKQNSEHFYFKSNYFTLNCNQMIASSNRKCVFRVGVRVYRSCVCVCVGVWIAALGKRRCENCRQNESQLVFFPSPFGCHSLFFCFAFFFFLQAEHRSRHTRTPAKDICVANEIFNIATRWTWIQ